MEREGRTHGLEARQRERRWERPQLPGQPCHQQPDDERRQDRGQARAEQALAEEVGEQRAAHHERHLVREPDTIPDVLRNVKMFTMNGITAPAIRPYTIGAGIAAAMRPVSPKTEATSTTTPASIEAPTSSGNVN